MQKGKKRLSFALCSSWTSLWLRWHEKHVNAWVCFGAAGNTYTSESMTQLLSALAALHIPKRPCPGIELSSLTPLFLGSAVSPAVPLRLLKWDPQELMYAVLFQGLSSPPASFPPSTCQGLLGGSAHTNANVAHDQLLNAGAKINRNHPILSLTTIHASSYKQNKHKTFSYD